MTTPATARPPSPEKLERELLSRLGLDPSASPEDLAAAHERVSAYLAAAPRELRSWARAQAAGADEAYALLTDPAALARAAALVGAGARPAVLPGGPATPPAHRASPEPAAAAAVPAAAARRGPVPADEGLDDEDPGVARNVPAPQVDEDGRRIVSDDDIDALLAEVDPYANPEIVGTAEERARQKAARPVTAAGPNQLAAGAIVAAAPRQGGLMGFLGSNAFRNIGLIGAVLVGVLIVANATGGSTTPGIGAGAGASAAPLSSAPALDMTAVASLMEKIQANPKDADSLMNLGNEYYKAGDYKTAADWFTKVTALEPTNVRGFLALGASAFNRGDMAAAETAWKQASTIDPKNVEAHYDLGYLYLNKGDNAGVQREWGLVVQLDPNGNVAKTVKAHLNALASIAPGSPAPSGGTPASSPASSPAASPAASGVPAPSAAPASPAGSAAP